MSTWSVTGSTEVDAVMFTIKALNMMDALIYAEKILDRKFHVVVITKIGDDINV